MADGAAADPKPVAKLGEDAPEARGADPIAANLTALRALFPDAFTEGKIDFDVLRQLLGDAVDEGEEKYGLNWSGKRQARRLALTPSAGTLLPAPGDSVDWETTKNLMIEGDNLEVLKLLQKSYAGRVKLIYIDPPYNTGNDFVYPDDYSDSLGSYLSRTGQSDAAGAKNTSNAESGGRFHTIWLDMIMPRLSLARGILSSLGFVVVSIDDSEVANLRVVMDSVFGSENHLVTLVYDRNRKNDAKLFSVGHEYMLVYARDASALQANGIKLRLRKEGVDESREVFESLKEEFGSDWGKIREGMLAFYKTIEEDDPRRPVTR